MTAREIAKEYFPNATDDEAGAVLWECTGFPAFFKTTPELPTNEAVMRRQLEEAREKSGADPMTAVAICNAELDAAMQQMHDRETFVCRVETWRVLG